MNLQSIACVYVITLWKFIYNAEVGSYIYVLAHIKFTHFMASIDRMDWHYGGDYPDNLPQENAGTHIGMFLTWIIDKDLIGEMHREDSQEAIQKVLNRQMTGREFLTQECDEKFWEEDLNEEGYAFTQHYYESDSYIQDYADTLATDVDNIYEVENTWENYDKLKPVIDKRYGQWKLSK
jgi:hypothetical protein